MSFAYKALLSHTISNVVEIKNCQWSVLSCIILVVAGEWLVVFFLGFFAILSHILFFSTIKEIKGTHFLQVEYSTF